MRTKIAGTIVAATLLAGGAVLYAAPWGREAKPSCGGPAGGPGMCGRMMGNPEQLKCCGATDDQVKKAGEVALKQRKQQIELWAKTKLAQVQLHYLMRSESPDKKAIMDAVDTLNAARGEAFKARITSLMEMREILGPDVCKKMRETCPWGRPEWGRHGKGDAGCGGPGWKGMPHRGMDKQAPPPPRDERDEEQGEEPDED